MPRLPGFYALPNDTSPIEGIQFYRSPGGREYHYWVVGEYDDLDWKPGCGKEPNRFQLDYNEEPIPAEAIAHTPDSCLAGMMIRQIAEMEEEEIPFRQRHGEVEPR